MGKKPQNNRERKKKNRRLGFGAAVALFLVLLLALGATGTATAQTDINGCTNINSAGSYEVTQDVNKSLAGYCFTVTGDDVVIDGNGNTIDATTTDPSGAISVSNVGGTVSNVTVENLFITDFETGVVAEDTEDVELVNVDTSSTETAVLVEDSTDVSVEGLTVSDTDIGVDVQSSTDVTVRDSSLLSTPFELPDIEDPIDDPDDPFDPPELLNQDDYSVGIQSSHEGASGVRLNETRDVVVENNTVSNFEEAGILVSAGNTAGKGSNEVIGNEVVNNTQGIFVATGGITTSPNQVVDNQARANEVGVVVFGISPSPRNEVSGNELTGNGDGIYVLSEDEDVIDNTVTDSSLIGIGMTGLDVDVRGNTVTGSGDSGIHVQQGSLHSIADNIVEDNGEAGIRLGGAPGSDVDNNTLVNNTATENGIYGIWLVGTDDNELRENRANENTNTGIYLNRTSTGNEIRDNTANDNGRQEGPPPAGTYGIWLEEGSNDNEIVGNEAFDNGIGGGSSIESAGIYLGGVVGPTNPVENNAVEDNTVGSSPSGSQEYGIWLVGANQNELRDNVAENNEESGIYLGGASVSAGADNNVLVNNTARGSEYGIWLSNALDNEVSESLVEDNHEGIAVEEQPVVVYEDVETESVGGSGNTFTEDISRNNDWDFVVESPNPGPVSTSATSSDFSVTDLNIGASTASDTTLSFNADDVRLRAVDTPESDPDDLENIGRYFEAEELSVDAYLNVSLSYEDGDVSGVNESTLELLRFDDGPSEWLPVGSSVDTANNLVSVNITTFSDFGAFGEAEDGDGGASPVEGVSDALWNAVTSQDGDAGNLSLADLGDAIQAYRANPSDADIDGVTISLADLGDLIQYYRNVVV
ncbi:MAG: right-handed parallel beta-helix repeat-containing protein [Halobacteriales archaeon]|nr:right-handed parallel beta-helix repeat-containing protein [Halobacteriales archaeon]